MTGPGSELVYDSYSITLDVRNSTLLSANFLFRRSDLRNKVYLVCVSEAAESETPTIRKAIDRFSTTFSLHILNIDVPRLPFVKVTGALPVIGVYVRREDLKQFATVAAEMLFSDTQVVDDSNGSELAKAAPVQESSYQVLHQMVAFL